MNWRNKYKKPFAISLIGLAGVAVFAFVALKLVGSTIEPQYCLMTEPIGEGVHIVLEGSKPETYTIEVEFPSGKRSIACNPEIIKNDFDNFYDHCTSDGALFDQYENLSVGDKPPKRLVVTIVFDGKQITKSFHPKYKIEYPDGKNCGMAYYTTIHFDLPE